MGFLSKGNVEKIKNEDYQKKMEEWAKKYPFTAYMMCSNDTKEEKAKRVEELYPTRS